MSNGLKNTYHRDGTVTYFSIYHRTRIHRAAAVPDLELAAMNPKERERTIRHTSA